MSLSLTALPADVLHLLFHYLSFTELATVARASVACSNAVLRCNVPRMPFWLRLEVCSRTQFSVGIGVEAHRRKMLGSAINVCRSCGSKTRRRVNSVVLCERCTTSARKLRAFMLPVCRVRRVMHQVYAMSDVNIRPCRLREIIDSSLVKHSSRQGKVVFVNEACELLNACPRLFRWIHATMPRD